MKTEKETIVVIDDDDDIVEWISHNLRREGYRVLAANSGLKAIWEMAGEVQPSWILLDVMMPFSNGYEICRHLKSSEEFSKVPVVMISAKGTAQDIRKGIQEGADAYLPKPFTMDELLSVLQAVKKDDFTHLSH